ncbi:Maf family protein [Acinetobacter larvae]|uniref:Nucleoside triphosphate pyrophosphatase n=1 Tax=Acinetobacter larvae TaxID=1789224 RepID=A0A1B2LZ08_9GAMM|nr:Maf family protein [Acinetobacter larvae]AOA58013.1 septum formation protein Maf [Acinetobacter larvae]
MKAIAPQHREIILASSSSTRKALLDRLGLDYRCIAPDIDESPKGEQHADALALRLAYEKAQHIAQAYPEAIVIGSDQVAWRTQTPQIFLGKPLTVDRAIAQLSDNAGQWLNFSTGLSVQCLARQFAQSVVAHYRVQLRDLSRAEIERYVAQEQPLHCAGSFKCEGLGISLFAQMQGNDQTTLMGLPLIELCTLLRQLGLQLP